MNVRVTPNTGGYVTLTRTLSVLSSPRNTASAAPEKHACADGYSGCGGVPSSGSHVASPTSVAILLAAAGRIAVIGRQCRRSYLSLKQAIWESAAATDKTGEEVQIVEQRCLALGGRRPCCCKPRYTGLHRPKHGCRRLIGSPRAAVARAKQLHFIEVGLEFRVVQAGRSFSCEATVESNHKRTHRAPMS